MILKYKKQSEFVKKSDIVPSLLLPCSDLRKNLSAVTTYDPVFYLKEMKDVIVRGGDFIILDPNFNSFYAEGLCFNDRENYLASEGNLVMGEVNNSFSGLYFLLGDNKNFYHWLINYAPRLLLYNKFSLDCTLILSKERPAFVDDTLKILGFKGDILEVNNMDYVRVERLMVPNFFQNPMHSPTGLSFIRDKFISKIDNSKKADRKIYLSRNDGGYRRIIKNENEVVTVVKSFGYEVVYPSKLTMLEQVEIFNSCSKLISPHGAGLANLMFMQPGGEVIELQNMNSYTKVFWELGKLSGCSKYSVIACNSAEGDTRFMNFRDLVVNIDELIAKLS
ncbi:glycosyltransferase family 61 protein [Neptunomonas phycophila]|uniref:glycosyltransferase family 61 protein n=1 Tax=Neptunomonas phycophila TaxID=1572645 RepID=UPI0026E39B36|nr:glycosyltransferase family 61 protein [Neptunomonas phycophila]MDO6467093.1 glycosyltransferase family 61 protein [Neptunomonas phycophila]